MDAHSQQAYLHVVRGVLAAFRLLAPPTLQSTMPTLGFYLVTLNSKPEASEILNSYFYKSAIAHKRREGVLQDLVQVLGLKVKHLL